MFSAGIEEQHRAVMVILLQANVPFLPAGNIRKREVFLHVQGVKKGSIGQA